MKRIFMPYLDSSANSFVYEESEAALFTAVLNYFQKTFTQKMKVHTFLFMASITYTLQNFGTLTFMNVFIVQLEKHSQIMCAEHEI